MTTPDVERIRILLVGLRALCEHAPPAPWDHKAARGSRHPTVVAADGPLYSTGNGKRSRESALAAAAYTAALDPQMIGTLCDIIDQLLTEREAALGAIQRMLEAVEGRGAQG